MQHRLSSLLLYDLPIDHVHALNETIIKKVTIFKGLGIFLDKKSAYKNHMDYTINRAKSVLTRIKSFSYEFDDPWPMGNKKII